MTIVKAHFSSALCEIGLTQDLSKKYATAFFKHVETLLINGTAIKIPYRGYLTAQFKKGGRQVREIRTGRTMTMRDTYNVTLSKTRNKDHEKMNWSEFLVSVMIDVPEIESAELLGRMFLNALRAVEEGDRMEIRGLGSFYCVKYKAKRGRNPKTGEIVQVKERDRLHFRSSRGLVRRVNMANLGHE